MIFIVIGYAWIGIFLGMGVIEFFSQLFSWHMLNGLSSLFQMALVASLGALSVWLGRRVIKSQKTEELLLRSIQNKVLEACGDSLPRFHHSEAKSSISLNEKNNEIVLSNSDGVVKSYPFASIRGWEIKEETAGQAPGRIVTGLRPGMIQGAFANQNADNVHQQALRQAALNTGLFIQVKDIDYAEWRISMLNKADRKRWFEILTQAINEGGVAA